MSYYSSPSINERRTGKTSIEVGEDDDYKELELVVHFDYHEWSEGHPYGETTAYERCSDISNEEYELDGESLSYAQLVNKLGNEDEVRAHIDRAIDNAN